MTRKYEILLVILVACLMLALSACAGALHSIDLDLQRLVTITSR